MWCRTAAPVRNRPRLKSWPVSLHTRSGPRSLCTREPGRPLALARLGMSQVVMTASAAISESLHKSRLPHMGTIHLHAQAGAPGHAIICVGRILLNKIICVGRILLKLFAHKKNLHRGNSREVLCHLLSLGRQDMLCFPVNTVVVF